MAPQNRVPDTWLMVILILGCVLVAVGVCPVQAHAAPHALPPRPPRTPPSPEPTLSSSVDLDGAWIELWVRFGDEALGRQWQNLWTVVQWQDASGSWHDVVGWRGALDRITDSMGQKVWWVDKKDFLTGPFRWTVHFDAGNRMLISSQPFYLPAGVREILTVKVFLVSPASLIGPR